MRLSEAAKSLQTQGGAGGGTRTLTWLPIRDFEIDSRDGLKGHHGAQQGITAPSSGGFYDRRCSLSCPMSPFGSSSDLDQFTAYESPNNEPAATERIPNSVRGISPRPVFPLR